MSELNQKNWKKVDFQTVLNKFGIEFIVNHAPNILYSKKDKEHEALNSLIAFFFVAGGYLVYLAISLVLMETYFNIWSLVIVSLVLVLLELILILNYLKSNIYIKPIECWFEVYGENSLDRSKYYALVYYPIFTGKCHPNKAKNIVYKLYQNEMFNTTIDITQIEKYFETEDDEMKVLGYYFQYGEGYQFNDENIERNNWKFFPPGIAENKNYIAVANWDHQYEWRSDLALDFDKLHDYAPWILKRWNEENLKPLPDEIKEQKFQWSNRNIHSNPKLQPWNDKMESYQFVNENASLDLKILEKAIGKVIGPQFRVSKVQDLEEELFKIQAYFRELKG